MARIWSFGAELQSVTAGIEFTSILTNAPALETSLQRSGVAALRISNTAAEGFRHIYTAAQGSYFLRFYLKINALPATTQAIGGFRISGGYKVIIRMTTTGALQLYNFEDSVQVGSNSSNLSTGTWYRVEIACDTTTLASTAVAARIDGTEFASGTIDLAANAVQIGIAHSGDATLDFIVDDLALNDTSGSFQNSWPGEGEVIHLRPSAAGDNAGWTRGGTDSGANWSQVDEITPNDTTDYVLSNTSGTTDDHNIDNTPAAMASDDVINVVQVGCRAAVDVTTGADPAIVLRIKASASGTVEESANLDVNSVTWQSPSPRPALELYSLTLYDLPGASTTAWTKADLDTAQIGIRESVTDTHNALVSAIWLLVDHKPAAVTAKAPPPFQQHTLRQWRTN